MARFTLADGEVPPWRTGTNGQGTRLLPVMTERGDTPVTISPAAGLAGVAILSWPAGVGAGAPA
jgi:hypothetical protein